MLKSLLLAIVVSASLDSTNLFIGDQVDLHLQATAPAEEHITWPLYTEQLTEDIEIVAQTAIDTTSLPDGRVQYSQSLTLTCFKDSLFYLEPIAFATTKADGTWKDSTWTEALTLNVIQPFEIDTTQALTDIKPIMKAPIWWWGIIRWILLALGIIALGVAIYFVGKYFERKRKGIVEEKKEPLRPAEEIAYEKLDKIKEEKVWQQGQLKKYQTDLTDVIREYIARRFEVSSTEKTSDETLREMKVVLNDQPELFASLRKMLQLADLVKFAKWTATPEENEHSLKTAYDFVKQTTPADQESQDNQTTNND